MHTQRFTVRFAVYLVLERDGKILLCKRHNTGHRDGQYGLPSGHLDGGETAQQGIIREAKEEVGVDIREENLAVTHVSHQPDDERTAEYINVYFTCSVWDGEPVNAEPEKCSEIRWVPYDQLPANTIDYVRFALEQIQGKHTYSNWGWNS